MVTYYCIDNTGYIKSLQTEKVASSEERKKLGYFTSIKIAEHNQRKVVSLRLKSKTKPKKRK